MTERDRLTLLDRRARDLAAALDDLRRYEAAHGGPPVRTPSEVYYDLKCAVWEAEAALNELHDAAERERLAALTPDGVQELRVRAQEDAIAAVARAQGWRWHDDTQRWQAPDGAYYSRTGEPLTGSG